MSTATAKQNTNNLFGEGGFKDPFKSYTYVDPLKTSKDYKDPLRVPKESYVDPVKAKPFKIPEFQSYNTYHEYKLPDIDPLTGRPYPKGRLKPKMSEDPKKSKLSAPKSLFPKELGSSVASTKRMLRIQENLNF